MSEKVPTASHLVWLDLEATDLPTEHDECWDFSGVHILEVGVIVTDKGLNIHQVGGYSEAVKMTPAAAAALRANDFVRKMHQENGLIKDCLASTKTLADIDDDLDAMLAEVGIPKGMFAMAGSGIAMYDLPAVKAKMPKLTSWLAYYPYDTGIFRRLVESMAGKYVTNPQNASYGEAKLHRAFADAEAHLREAQSFRDWVRSLPTP